VAGRDRDAKASERAETVARALLEVEEHNPKLVYVMRREWSRTGRRAIYRDASAFFTKTPNVPKITPRHSPSQSPSGRHQ